MRWCSSVATVAARAIVNKKKPWTCTLLARRPSRVESDVVISMSDLTLSKDLHLLGDRLVKGLFIAIGVPTDQRLTGVLL